MATPIARPMTVPPPFPADLSGSEVTQRLNNGFIPSATLLSDFMNILAQLADFFKKFKASGQILTVTQEEFLNLFSIDNIADDLLLEDRGWSLAHNLIQTQIKAIFASLKEIEKTAGENIVFPFTQLSYTLNLSAEAFAFLLSEFFEVSVITDTKFTNIQSKEKSLPDINPAYVQFLTQQRTEIELLNLLKQSITVLYKFYQELGVDFNNLLAIELKSLTGKISSNALLRFLGHHQQVEKDAIYQKSDNPEEQKLRMGKEYWPRYYKLINKEAVSELKHTILETASGRRNLSSNLWQKIRDQISNKFSRDLKAEQDIQEIEDIGRQLKAMIGYRNNNPS